MIITDKMIVEVYKNGKYSVCRSLIANNCSYSFITPPKTRLPQFKIDEFSDYFRIVTKIISIITQERQCGGIEFFIFLAYFQINRTAIFTLWRYKKTIIFMWYVEQQYLELWRYSKNSHRLNSILPVYIAVLKSIYLCNNNHISKYGSLAFT